MRAIAVFLAAALFAVPVTANAQTAAAPAATSGKATKNDPDRMICKTLPTTGSRLKAARDCRTAKQWAEDQALDRRDIDRMQTNRYKGQ